MACLSQTTSIENVKFRGGFELARTPVPVTVPVPVIASTWFARAASSAGPPTVHGGRIAADYAAPQLQANQEEENEAENERLRM